MLKTSKKILSTIMVVIMVLTAVPLSSFVGIELPAFDLGIRASALAESGQCGENVYWSYDSATGELVIRGSGSMKNYEYYEEAPFLFSDIKTIIIEDGITSIGDYIFCGCSALANISIPNSVTSIGDNSFRHCSNLKKITIPNSVLSIKYGAFYDCSNLLNITILNSVTSIGEYAFLDTAFYNNNDNWKNDVLYIGNYLIKARESLSGSYIIKEGTKVIADNAFSGCTNLISITIPDSVTTIGSGAFDCCNNLTSVTIPNSVTTVGKYAFNGCTKLENLDIGDGVTSLEGFCDIAHKDFDDYYSTYEKSYYPNLKTLTIGKGIKEIPTVFFAKSTALETVNLSEGLEKIGDEAFADCPYLETINFPDSLKYMGNDILKNTAWFNYKGKGLIIQDNWAYGFKGTESGITVNLPANVKGIADRSITGDINVVACEADKENPYFSSEGGVLFNKDKTVLIACPAGKAFTSYVIPDTVEEILGEAFANGDYNYLTMGKSVKKIGYDAFSGAGVINVYVDNLESWCNIEFENGSANPLIKNGRLYVDGNLVSSLVIPDTITEIKPYAFRYCGSIDDVTIPDSVVTIGESAFQNCSSLVSVSFGKGLKTIEAFAFYNCLNIKDVFYPGSQEEWEKIIIDSNKGGDGYIRNANLFLMHSHEYTETVVKQVSCTSDGEILYTCIHGDTITEILYASGHNWVDLGGSVKATCTTDGVDNYKCSNCGEEKKGTTPAMDHNWEYLELTYETCDKDGYMLRTCQREGCNAKEEKVTPATHDLEEWNVKSPTCTESGEKSVSCMDCTYSAVVVLPAKGHTYSEWVELLPATCSERGLNIKICNDCNDIQRQIIPKLAHIDADGNGVCDTCENTDTPDVPNTPDEPDTPYVPDTPNEPDVPEDPSANCSCNCHKSGLSKIIFNIILFFQKLLRSNKTCICGVSHY